MLQPTHESFLETFLENSFTFNRILDDPRAFAAQSEALAEPWRSRFLSLWRMARGEFGQAESLLASTPSDDKYARLLRLRALRAQDKFQEALPQLEAWWNSFPNKAEEKDLWATAGLLLGYTYSETGKPELAVAEFDRVLSINGPDLLVARALIGKGVALGKLQRLEDALQVFIDVELRFGECQESGILEQVAMALINKGGVLFELQRFEDALQVYEDLERKFGKRQEPGILEPVASALVNKGLVLGELKRPEDALQVCEEVERRFGERREPGILEQVGYSLVIKSLYLTRLGKREESRKELEAVLALKGLPNGKAKGFALYNLCRYYSGETNDAKLQEFAREIQKLDPWTPQQEFEELQKIAKDYLSGIEKRAALHNLPPATPSASEPASNLTTTEIDNLLLKMFNNIDNTKKESFFKSIKAHEEKRDYFLEKDGAKWSSRSFLLILREWNSYTPALPSHDEEDRGGGYFLYYKGHGVVIDPGYDFISHFERAGGRLEDIDDIIITHAHNDHTAQLEDILTLLHKYNKIPVNNDSKTKLKKINLYMNQGAYRKFSGLIDLKDKKLTCHTLERPGKGAGVYSLPLCNGLKLMPLPAHHDDVITSNSAVGLWFTLDFQDEEKKPYQRHLVFTADSGIYPTNEDGEFKCDNDNEALEALYRDAGLTTPPDLLVAHIGAIQEKEFNPDTIGIDRDKGYYPMHLGIRGTARIIYSLSPKAAVVSEFGSEMRDIRDDVVNAIANAITDMQKSYNIADNDRCFVLPGDLTTLYDIERAFFYCHDTKKCVAPVVGLHKVVSAASYATREFDPVTNRNNALLERCSRDPCGKPVQRAYIMENPPKEKWERNRLAEDYFRALFNGEIELLKKLPKK